MLHDHPAWPIACMLGAASSLYQYWLIMACKPTMKCALKRASQQGACDKGCQDKHEQRNEGLDANSKSWARDPPRSWVFLVEDAELALVLTALRQVVLVRPEDLSVMSTHQRADALQPLRRWLTWHVHAVH